MIYKGSQKEGKVYKGGTKIGKIYKGSQLVYQSQKQLRLYGYDNNGDNAYYLVGGISTFNPYLAYVKFGYSGIRGESTITAISGTLGTSNSSITATYYNGSSTLYTGTGTYSGTYNINNVILHRYFQSGSLYGLFWVIDGSTIGNCALTTRWININYGYGFPSSIQSNTFTFRFESDITTGSRNSSLDKTWTMNGVY